MNDVGEHLEQPLVVALEDVWDRLIHIESQPDALVMKLEFKLLSDFVDQGGQRKSVEAQLEQLGVDVAEVYDVIDEVVLQLQRGLARHEVGVLEGLRNLGVLQSAPQKHEC